MERNHYIDFLKGIAAINIIFIHTVFWSGESYVPLIMRSLSLIIDVPFFFFLSGWGTSLSSDTNMLRKIRSNISTYGKWVLYTIFAYLFIAIYNFVMGYSFEGKRAFIDNFVHNLFFANTSYNISISILGATWFLPVFFRVSIILCALLCLFKTKRDALTLLLITIIGTGFKMSGREFFFLDLNFCFYSVFFLVGYLSKKITITLKRACLITICLLVFYFAHCFLLSADTANMQALKFPPTWAYMSFSFIAITFSLYFKKYAKKIGEKNIFALVGRNALSFYFCHSIPMVLLFHITPHINTQWYFKLILCFAIHIAMTIVLVWLYNLSSKFALRIVRSIAARIINVLEDDPC